jgi:hypothetical protein
VAGHFILCNVSGSFEQLNQLLKAQFGKMHYELLNTTQGQVAIMLDESYFFRSNSTSAVLIVAKEKSAFETNIEIISCAGASGLANFSWGVEGSYVQDVLKKLKESGFAVEVLEEIPYYNSSKRQS